jgi:hypothetical protein
MDDITTKYERVEIGSCVVYKSKVNGMYGVSMPNEQSLYRETLVEAIALAQEINEEFDAIDEVEAEDG